MSILLAYTGFDQVMATVEDHFVLAPVWIVIYKSTSYHYEKILGNLCFYPFGTNRAYLS